MSRTPLAILVFLAIPSLPTFAQDRAYCYQALGAQGFQSTGGFRRHVRGFAIEARPETIDGADECHVTIKSPSGKVVFEIDDWGIELLPISGKDINGDGAPDAVLMSFSGGAHCCFTYWIVSLGKSGGLVASLENQFSAEFSDLRKDGRIEIVTIDGSWDEFEGLPHGLSPSASVVLQLRGKQLKEVGKSFWIVYQQQIDEARRELSPEQTRRFRLGDLDRESIEYLEVKMRVLTIVASYLYGGREADAWKALDELWPPDDKERAKQEISIAHTNGLRSSGKVAVQ